MWSYNRRVHYYETDKMGVVHHSNYIRWFEEARVDMMKDIGLDYKKCEELGLMLPVIGVSCKYKSSAKFDDVVEIACRVTKFNGVKLNISYVVKDTESDSVLVVGESEHCFVNLDFKPIRVKKEFPRVFDILNDLVEKED